MDEKETKIDIKFFEEVFDVLVKNLKDKKDIDELKKIISDETLPPYQLAQNYIFDDIILFFLLLKLIMII